MSNLYLNNEEQITFSLRSLYEAFGYSRYEMSKFEEYDLYVRFGDSLISEGVITFTDTNGKLMALTPDVTLSIIKNGRDSQGVQKVYYDEKVYRVSKGTSSFKEIPQVGLECMGEIDNVCIAEVLRLAAESLCAVSENAVLDISHLGIAWGIMDAFDISKDDKKEIAKCIGEKNIHELEAVCRKAGMDESSTALLCKIAALHGKPCEVFPALYKLLPAEFGEVIDGFKAIIDSLPKKALDIINIDFSAGTDFGYYNGIVFKGYVMSVPNAVISGGQYDKLMKKMGRTGSAIGFAVYPEMLQQLSKAGGLDADILLLYSTEENAGAVLAEADKLRNEGNRVAVAKKKDIKKNYGKIFEFKNGEVKEVENNA